MPIQKRWSRFTKKRLQSVSKVRGIYELGDANREVLYIGKGGSESGVKSRLGIHKVQKPKSVRLFRAKPASLFESPIQMEHEECAKFKKKHGRLPRLQKRMPRDFSFW